MPSILEWTSLSTSARLFRRMREKLGIGQEALVLSAGVDRTYVGGIEREVRNPSLKSMQRLATELDVSLDCVFVLARQLAEERASAS